MRVLVTGGSGFLGVEVVRHLRARGDEVRVLTRSGSPTLETLGAELVAGDVVRSGDLEDEGEDEGERAAGARRPSLASTLADCDALVHLAGFVSRDPADGQRMMRLHVDGTRRALEAAAAAGVRRVVVASSAGTSAVSLTPIALDERAPYAHALVEGSPYYLSCIYKEQVATQLARELELELVIVSPSLLLGPGDARGASTLDLRAVVGGRPFRAQAGGTSVVDVRDAAAAIVAAITNGRAGERYFLGAAELRYDELYARTARLAGVRAPWRNLPDRAAPLLARLRRTLGPTRTRSEEHRPLYWYCQSDKAKRELAFAPRELMETLADTVRDLVARAT
jgi:dihydroflavonol-4-reductase